MSFAAQILVVCVPLIASGTQVPGGTSGDRLVEPARQFDPADFTDVLVRGVDRAGVVELNQMGLDVQSVKGTDVLLYLSTDQVERLDRLGYDLTVLPRVGTRSTRAGYHTFSDLTTNLQAIAAAYPSICELHDIGSSHQGRELWFMKISDNVGVEENEPEFRYISSMHGDEVVGMELCIDLIELLTSQYGTDPQITNLVNEVEIWIMPMMNPDGFVAGSRYNAHGYDLNRSFPDRVYDPTNTTAGRPLETQHVMNWGFAHSPVLSANFHGGSLVVNYPYDSDPNPFATYSASPDDALFIQQSLTYTTLNTPLYNSYWFPQGITNGVEWYAIDGGMQDWNYVWQGCNDVTIELDDEKWPSFSRIAGLWNDNRASMLAYMELCLTGVRGVVTDGLTGAPLDATIRAVGIDHDVYTDPDVGDFHRMLLPGTYSVQISAPGYVTQTFPGVLVASGVASVIDAGLMPEGVVAYGCGTNPPDSISLVSGTPTIGSAVVFGVDNPQGTQAVGSFPFLALAAAADPNYPCGTLLPNWGMASAGSSGELLISLLPPNPLLLLTGAPWLGAGTPAPITLNIPNRPSLVGRNFYVQGVLFDPTAIYGIKFGLTEAFELSLGA